MQPSLSQFLVHLETEAQTELVDRSAKPLKLTAAGALFLRTEKQVDLLRETFCLAEVLPVFHRLYPLIEVSLTEGRTKELEKMALEGAVDFSLVIRSVSL